MTIIFSKDSLLVYHHVLFCPFQVFTTCREDELQLTVERWECTSKELFLEINTRVLSWPPFLHRVNFDVSPLGHGHLHGQNGICENIIYRLHKNVAWSHFGGFNFNSSELHSLFRRRTSQLNKPLRSSWISRQIIIIPRKSLEGHFFRWWHTIHSIHTLPGDINLLLFAELFAGSEGCLHGLGNLWR